VNPDLLVPGALVALLVLVLVLFGWLARDRRRTHAELQATREDARQALAEVAALRVRVTAAEPRPEATEYVITDLGDGSGDPDEAAGAPYPTPEAGRIEGKLFADLVFRETVVKAAAFGHGVRRAIRPESRNRIRFEVRREIKRSRKERRDELKQVRREMRDRQRASVSAE
jgi:hypothetical protein